MAGPLDTPEASAEFYAGRHYRRYEHLMGHWRRVLPADRILDVCYEDVVADLEARARRIIARCGLPQAPIGRSRAKS